MKMIKKKKHLSKKWEVSIIEYQNDVGKKYKVTRRIPELLIAETRIVSNKEKARKLFDEWLE